MKHKDTQLDGYLGGQTPLRALPDDVRREEEVLQALLGMIREDVRAPAALHESVMREIESAPVPVLKRLLDWCLRPRAVRISPAMSAAAVAVAAALFLLWPGPDLADVARAPSEGPVEVVTRFVFVAPGASSVRVTGDFLEWSQQGIELEDLRGTGIWTADVPLPPGVYQYAFVVDGTEWRVDPRAVSQVDDGFGQVNSVVIVSAESEA